MNNKTIAAIAAGVIVIAAAAYFAFGKKDGAPSPEAAATAPAQSTQAPVDMGGGVSYREFIQGEATAKVTMIEYASLTCPHCAQFQVTVFPEIKKNYIDTGKVRFVFRDYPLDGLALAGAVLAARAPGDRGKMMVEMMFKNQDQWVRTETPIEPLKGYAQLAGMSSDDVDACLKNEAMIKTVREIQNTADTLYKVEATPTFFINDEKVTGDPGYESLAETIEKHLKD